MARSSLSNRIRVNRQRVEHLVQRVLGGMGLVGLRRSTFEELHEFQSKGRVLEMLRFWQPSVGWDEIEKALAASTSQLQQDLLALLSSRFKKGGYFVEFGATNGVTLSNTFMLEKTYGWSGILAEPAKMWTESLRENRDAHIVDKAVWSRSGEVIDFFEQGELSTLSGFEEGHHKQDFSARYPVETVSLSDLLDKQGAPEFIDFLSIDTEGSELEILSSFDFSRYRFGLIAVEHGRSQDRSMLLSLLESFGYVRILNSVSGWDDWYVPTPMK